MTFTKARFASFEEYLSADASDLPEGRYEYWDGELVPVMSESPENDDIANYIFFLLLQMGVYRKLIRPHSCEIEVIGNPKTRFPDLTVLDNVHLVLMAKSNRVTRKMPPPRLVVEVVSPGDESKPNYKRDYIDKRDQYAAIDIPEYWLVDPEREWVMVGTLVSSAYQFIIFRGNDAIVSPTFPELKLTAAIVFEA
ncbi:MAG: Uma2 family endonuclease [Cyanobacteria bacterium]|nr:Uma2 family endonuclease [Cyanobacteriota bacterium]